MDPLQIEALLKDVREGRTAVPEAIERLRHLPFEDLGFAKLDHHRALRTGMPETIFSQGKTTEQVAAIFTRMAKAGGNVLATRASLSVYSRLFKLVEPCAPEYQRLRGGAITLACRPPGEPRQGDLIAIIVVRAPATCPWPRKQQ